jgi:putative PIN family toxin of toxin-antitoxin system
VSRQPRAIADVNVLVSAVRTPNGLCGRLLDGAVEGQWQLVVSPLLLDELKDVLARPAFLERLGEETTARFLRGLIAIAELVEDPPGTAPRVTGDPDDDYLVALALTANTDVLISGDHHLTDLTSDSVLIETPRDFLARFSKK